MFGCYLRFLPGSPIYAVTPKGLSHTHNDSLSTTAGLIITPPKILCACFSAIIVHCSPFPMSHAFYLCEWPNRYLLVFFRLTKMAKSPAWGESVKTSTVVQEYSWHLMLTDNTVESAVLHTCFRRLRMRLKHERVLNKHVLKYSSSFFHFVRYHSIIWCKLCSTVFTHQSRLASCWCVWINSAWYLVH